MTDMQKRVKSMNDVDLVRMLTLDADLHSAEFLEAGNAEARHRGLPIDPKFIPATDPEEPPPGDEETDEFRSGSFDVRCTQ
jgi:hypothetical protein